MDIEAAKNLNIYLFRIYAMSRANGSAPHKPVFLLSLLDAIDLGFVIDNFFRITPELTTRFLSNWNRLQLSGHWHPKMAFPFRYLINDGFWEVVINGRVLSADELGTPGSLIQLVELVDGGRLSDELWQLLQDQEARDMLRREILRAYFPSAARERGVLGDAEADILAEEAKLIDEAEAQFKKIRRRSGIENDYGYNRHLLFPRVVKGLYGGACALCRLDVKIPPAASLVDGAHILPFAKYHNDDPRNGIALCKNHHWGFDAGWFGITDDYRVIVSPKVTANRRFVENGASVLIPANRSLAPAIEALRWHRENLVMKD